ncbi:Crp/Fnr family transcriptional regulator [Marinibacterium profundimaris]|uniref:Crp/Fnr family transcriptional regulator n=1 Tax=Marinibacterium profundimaris TaxID=1679460 RepID=A0A225NGC6_9RHOB|nr:Crp/Fnr family transcriptional regulator [Marinibacterium profundimaris]OWU72599.1 Crp/Fnr family transcriptional regulator [Marinibacterium profundimaris]
MTATKGFLSTASAALIDILEGLSTEIRMTRGQVLFEAGDPGDALFAVTEGALEISVYSEDGRKLTLDIMRAGSILGEITLFDPGPRTATATALEPTVLRRVRHCDVLSEITKTPELAIDLIHLAGKRMRYMNRQLNEQVFLPVPLRLARKILYLTQSDDPAKLKDHGMSLRLSQAELAEFVGATREAVSKTLSNWKKDGVVEASRGGLTVLDRPALELIAEPEFI